MKKKEALELLESAPESDKPSRVNPGLTLTQGKNIVIKAIESYKDEETIPSLMIKRVHQISQNRKRPKY